MFRTGSHAVIGPSMSSNVLSVLLDAAQAQVISVSDYLLILARRASGLVSRMHTMVPTLKFKTVPLLQVIWITYFIHCVSVRCGVIS